MGTIRVSSSFAVTPPGHVEADARDLLHVTGRYTGSLPHDEIYRLTWDELRAPITEGGFGVGVSSGWPLGKWGVWHALDHMMDPDNIRKNVAAARKDEGPFAGRVIFSNSCYTMSPQDVKELKVLLNKRASDQQPRDRGQFVSKVNSGSTPTK